MLTIRNQHLNAAASRRLAWPLTYNLIDITQLYVGKFLLCVNISNQRVTPNKLIPA
jgi:hypothetical protein